MADPTGVPIRLGWHLVVKCVAALVPGLWRHHTLRVDDLVPQVAEDPQVAEGHLAEDHLLARATNQILRCDKSELP